MPERTKLVSRICVSAALIATVTWLVVSIVARGDRRSVPVTGIAADQGFAFSASLEETDGNAVPKYLIEKSPLRPEDKGWLERVVDGTRIYYYIGNHVEKKYGFSVSKRLVGRALGPGGSSEEEIRAEGEGRFRLTEDRLLFSTSDNSSPLSNGADYYLTGAVGGDALPVALSLTIGLSALLLGLFSRRLLGTLTTYSLIVLGSVLAFGLVYEVILRVKIPFTEEYSPSFIDPDVGHLWVPGETTRRTNHVDFWTETKVNSLGFLDFEPVRPKPAGTFRVLFLGDSFVQAVQVENHEKSHVLLAERLRKAYPDRRIDTVAISRGGTGTIQQASLYEKFGRSLDPDLVIVLLVINDLADNHPLLDAIRTNLDPEAPVRPRLSKDQETGELALLPVASDWHQRRPGGNVVSRLRRFRNEPRYADLLTGWNYPDDLTMELMFFAEEMPGVFHQAVDLTGDAFDYLARASARDGFRLMFVATENISRTEPGQRYRETTRTKMLDRYKELLESRDLPLLDLYPAFQQRGDVLSAIWPHNGHWNQRGHRWTADAILDYLVANPRLLQHKTPVAPLQHASVAPDAGWVETVFGLPIERHDSNWSRRIERVSLSLLDGGLRCEILGGPDVSKAQYAGVRFGLDLQWMQHPEALRLTLSFDQREAIREVFVDGYDLSREHQARWLWRVTEEKPLPDSPTSYVLARQPDTAGGFELVEGFSNVEKVTDVHVFVSVEPRAEAAFVLHRAEASFVRNEP